MHIASSIAQYSLILVPQKKGLNEKEVNPDPSWRELGSRLKRITPYLWPSKSVPLQFTAVRVYITAMGFMTC